MDAFTGAVREIRTLDSMIKSHVLYHLSYNRIWRAPIGSNYVYRLYQTDPQYR